MKKKWKITLISLALLVIIFLFTNIYLIFLLPLDIGSTVDSHYGDVILVLGGGLKKGRQLELGFSTEERLRQAVKLFKKKKRVIIISGGSLYRSSPAIPKIKEYFKKFGIDSSYLRFEGKSQTTYDNFVYSDKMIRKMKFREIVVTTSPYHTRRSRLILSYLGVNNFKITNMESSEVYNAHSVRQRLRNMRLIFREYLAILKFKIFKK